MEELFEKIAAGAEEYQNEFRPMLEAKAQVLGIRHKAYGVEIAAGADEYSKEFWPMLEAKSQVYYCFTTALLLLH